MSLVTIGLAFVAGALSVLAPCVLPLLPLVLTSAASTHWAGPLALASGLALSFTAIGLFVATIGFAMGLDADWFRYLGGGLMLAVAAALLLPGLYGRLAAAAGPLSNGIDRVFGGFSTSGLSGQFALGGLLGAVWAPCVGPTLGAASVLAAQGKDLAQVAVTMLAFGIGAGLPLVMMGLVSRDLLLRLRPKLAASGQGGKLMLGGLFAVVGLLTITGADKTIETILVDASPDWLTDLTTRY